MQQYRSSLSSQVPSATLTHFGSLSSALHRIHTQYVGQYIRGFNGKKFVLHDYYGSKVGEESLEEALEAFTEFVKNSCVRKFELNIKKSLRLKDCWEDDPIGSGAMGLFEGNGDLTSKQRAELKAIFAPFVYPIFPQDIMLHLSPRDVKKMKNKWRTNAIFKDEFLKRQERSHAIGENFTIASVHETVWLDKTMQLRKWALDNGYDSFVYENNSEGAGEDSFVTLKKDQIKRISEPFVFCEEKYRDLVWPDFSAFIQNAHNQAKRAEAGASKQQDTFWSGFDPEVFWSH